MSRVHPLLLLAVLVPLGAFAPTREAVVREIDVEGSVYSLAFSPDGKLLAGQVGSLIYLWDPRTGTEVRRIAEEPAPGLWSVAFSADGKTIYAPLQDHSVASWDVATGKLVRLFKGHSSTVWSATVAPDGKLLASGGEDQTVRLWDTATGKERCQLRHASGVWPFLFAPDGKSLVSVGSDGTLYIWDVATGKETKQFKTEASTWPLALSADGRTAATLRWLGTTVRLWDLDTGKEKHTLEVHPGTGWNLAFMPDGRTLAAGGPGNTLRLWETATGQERACLEGLTGAIDALACSPDGRTIAGACKDSKLLLWDRAVRPQGWRPGRGGPTAAELESLWKDLAGTDGVRAYRAVWALVDAADGAVPFLAGRVGKELPRAPLDAARVEQWIRDLDDNDFAVREKASAELEKRGPAVAATLRQALAANPPPERTRRLEALLEKLDRGAVAPEVSAGRRGVEALELIGTPEARHALEQVLASKAPAEVVEDARLSLRRLAGRK